MLSVVMCGGSGSDTFPCTLFVSTVSTPCAWVGVVRRLIRACCILLELACLTAGRGSSRLVVNPYLLACNVQDPKP